jgi:hypothetical protein
MSWPCGRRKGRQVPKPTTFCCRYSAWFAIGTQLYGTGRSSIWIAVACGSALACGFDLRRSRSAGPGRIVACSVLAIAAVADVVFAIASPI